MNKRSLLNKNTSVKKRLMFNRKYLSIPYGAFMLIFTVVPIFILLFYAFSKRGSFGNELTFDFTMQNFISFFSGTNLKLISRSLWIGLLTTAICLLIGYPTAYILANKKYNTSKTLILLFVLPMWINFLLRTLATKAMFDFIGISLGMGTVIFGMVYNFLPFMILPIYTTIQKIDKSLIEAANDLGASNNQTFSKVILPLSLPGILSGITMVFTPTITTFVVSDMLSNNKISLIGNAINNSIGQLDYNTASAMSMIILVLVGVTMLVVNRYDKDKTSAGGGLW
ncbi:MAG: ABC transporter permease [Clostridia bacterium]